MPDRDLWEHDLWADVYGVHDAQLRHLLVQLYRLILDMRNDDVLAQKIASAIHHQAQVRFTAAQKAGATLVGLIALADFVRGVVAG